MRKKEGAACSVQAPHVHEAGWGTGCWDMEDKGQCRDGQRGNKEAKGVHWSRYVTHQRNVHTCSSGSREACCQGCKSSALVTYFLEYSPHILTCVSGWTQNASQACTRYTHLANRSIPRPLSAVEASRSRIFTSSIAHGRNRLIYKHCMCSW